ncbi:hypothetical protein RHMOL_Rhmol02G0237000 [Rhododendron molle]|uniref:Uncharacterized protein n=1 Tax=Rhododendron molle TaxID=49168 RepID=A0ACC0PUT5_RHOML|nr:hypothetical protein RHMOL_Rhmol02G0237000 [Rhododendron molle]
MKSFNLEELLEMMEYESYMRKIFGRKMILKRRSGTTLYGCTISEDLIVFGADYAAFVANSLALHGVVEYRRGEVAIKPSSRRGCHGDGGQPDLLVLDWRVVEITSIRSNRVTEVLVLSNLPFTLPPQLDQGTRPARGRGRADGSMGVRQTKVDWSTSARKGRARGSTSTRPRSQDQA